MKTASGSPPHEELSEGTRHFGILYALCMVVLGFVFPTSVYMSEYKVSWLLPVVFHNYMLITSIVFLLYFMLVVMNLPSQTVAQLPFGNRLLVQDNDSSNQTTMNSTMNLGGRDGAYSHETSNQSTVNSSVYPVAHIQRRVLGATNEAYSPPQTSQRSSVNSATNDMYAMAELPRMEKELSVGRFTVASAEVDTNGAPPNEKIRSSNQWTSSDGKEVEDDGGLILKIDSGVSPENPASNSLTTNESPEVVRAPRKIIQFDAPPSTPSSTVNNSQNNTITRKAARRYRTRLNSTIARNALELGMSEIPPFSLLSITEAHSPSFFLRIGCFAFGFFSIVHDFFGIIDHIYNLAIECKSKDGMYPLRRYFEIFQSCVHILFMVLQTFFIFKHSKVSFNTRQGRTIFGLMHLLATNLCYWLYVLLLETSHSASFMKYPAYKFNNTNTNTNRSCVQLFWNMGPYLFPFTVEYSLMAAVSCYVLYLNVGKYLNLLYQKGINKAQRSLKKRKQAQSQFSVDCYKSEKGFFVGALSVAVAVVSAVFFLYTVTSNSPENDKEVVITTAMLIYHATDLFLVCIGLPVTFFAIYQLRKLQYKKSKLTGPDGILLLITLFGVLLLEMFEGVEALYDNSVIFLWVKLLESILSVAQCLLQTYLVVDGENRQAHTEEYKSNKPGREAVAFMMMLNIAQWVVYSLETREMYSHRQKSQAYVNTFDYTAMLVVTYLCVPLQIFFRFHSTCCLVEIWRHAYSDKKHSH